MKKIYEKPVIHTTAINAKETTAASLLSSTFTIHAAEITTKSWTTVNY
ncbi:MAG: hypothetical protein LIO87_04195 [Eubacterium sp.]|nr:hypothetical protein [Eubacterium sp.]